MPDLYSLLGLSRHANREQIKAAYWTRAKQSHPDLNAGAREAERRTKEINFAYEILGDPEARAAYDLRLGRQRAKARRSFWSAAAIGATTFILTAGSVPVMVMWRQHAEIHRSPSGDPTLPTGNAESKSMLAIPPAEDRANLRPARPEDSERGPVPNEPLSRPPPWAIVEPWASSNSEIRRTPLRDREAKKKDEPTAPSILAQKEQVASASLSEPVSHLQLLVPPAHDREAPQQKSNSAPGAGDTKRFTSAPVEREPVVKKAINTETQVKHPNVKRLAASPSSGYEVPGCAFYALAGTKVVQHCPSVGSPAIKPFWYNDDAFEGGYGGGSR